MEKSYEKSDRVIDSQQITFESSQELLFMATEIAALEFDDRSTWTYATVNNFCIFHDFARH